MAKFKKRPVVIEAFEFTEDVALRYLIDREPLPFADIGVSGDFRTKPRILYRAWINIETLEGTMRAYVGDWIIRGVKGELYPCKPDVFAATYEPVEGA